MQARALKQFKAKRCAGVDEAGRGPLAGPVVAAAVVMPIVPELMAGIADSKALSASEREGAYERLRADGRVGVGIGVVDHATIDEINILQADAFFTYV